MNIVLLNIAKAEGGSIAQWLAYLLPDPAALGLISCILNLFYEEFFDVAEVNQCRFLEEGGQWLENVNQTH